jgi:hypothetical protein
VLHLSFDRNSDGFIHFVAGTTTSSFFSEISFHDTLDLFSLTCLAFVEFGKQSCYISSFSADESGLSSGVTA